jgi:A/G-specific adenine glycosylase
MLQQTQVGTVIPFYRKFLRTFPTVTSLARAPLERVLEFWSGLGYYRRARHLHAAARQIVAGHRGRFPRSLREARSLPGVGSYTAAAVLSIAYGAPVAALDGNVARVIARLEARKGSLAEPAFRRAVAVRLANLVSRRSPGDFNQALMELGQTICLPRAPHCNLCPVRWACRGFGSGGAEQFPLPRPRRSTEEHHLAAAVAFGPTGEGSSYEKERVAGRSKADGRAVLVLRGLDEGLLPDLWNFPAAFGSSPAAARSSLNAKLATLGAGSLGPELGRLRHTVTFRNIQVRVYSADLKDMPRQEAQWLALSRFSHAAVSQLSRKIAALIPIPSQASQTPFS